MRPARAAAAAVALAALLAAPAHAAKDMELGIADDNILLAHPEQAPAIVARWQALGIQVVRIHARWVSIAPGTGSPVQPADFHPTDPDDPQYDWNGLDNAVALVRSAGMRPMLAVTGSGPVWSSQDPSLDNPRYRPDPRKFADFATAVARRYGPVVDRYLIWNEPNQPGWLQPQFTCAGSKCTPQSPHIYRALVRAAYPAIKAADPGAQVLIGTLAPRGGAPVRRNAAMRPLTFIRALGCVNDRFRPLRSGPCAGFRPAVADGFAYHPHGVLLAPDEPNPKPDEAAIADLGRLEDTLDRTTSAGGFQPTTGRFDIYITEFGYQTDPPDPYSGVPPVVQARWLQQATYIAWKDPRVKTFTQYEWRDETVDLRGDGPKAYAGWQSGLLFSDGTPKPALAAFANPFWIDVKPGAKVGTFWGQVRGPSAGHVVTIVRRSPGGGSWARVATVPADSAGYWSVRLPVPRAADYQFTYDVAAPLSQRRPFATARSVVLPVRPALGVVPLAAASRVR